MSKKLVFCIATGPSLTPEDVFLVSQAHDEGHGCVVVSDAYNLATWADVHVAYDSQWWFHHWGKGIEKFSGLKCCPDPDVASRFNLRLLQWPIDNVPHGLDSGYYGIAAAIKFGAKNIVLLGYDMKHGKDGKTHFFGDHESPLRNSSPYKLFLEKYKDLSVWCVKNGISIVNCTRDSDLNFFKKKNLNAIAYKVCSDNRSDSVYGWKRQAKNTGRNFE